MQKFFKSATIFSFVIAAALFGLVFFGEKTLPDEICITDGSTMSFGSVFTLDYPENAVQARANAPQSTVVQIRLFGAVPVKSSSVTVVRRQYVIPGGGVFGLRLYTDGLVIVGSEKIETKDGSVNPSDEAGLENGDAIISIDGKKMFRNSDASLAFEQSGGKTLSLLVRRSGKTFTVGFTPALCERTGKYKAGLWVRDSSAGVGTVTFIKKDSGVFGGLGHAVCDVDTGEIMPMLEGDTVETTVRSCTKGSAGSPGELCGVFGAKTTGALLKNGDTGVFGCFESVPDEKQIPVALPREVEQGAAQIICTMDTNGKRLYDVEITKVSKAGGSDKKNLVVKVTDPELIDATGGIVQGMSGSPIIQNGMLVGAVTHVFVNDPLQGYGIFAQTMLESSAEIEKGEASGDMAA